MKSVLVLQHAPHVPLGSAATFLADAGLNPRTLGLFDEVPARLPFAESAGLIVLGGPMNANQTETYPFLQSELDWIREAVDRQVPTLGICLGAQLLAKALGEKVYPNPVKEIGWYSIEVLPTAGDDSLFAGCRPVETVFQWHGDTFDLPLGAVPLARSRLCPNQAFRHGPCAYGLQFHVEMTPGLMEEWLSEAGFRIELAELSYIDPQAIRAAAREEFPAMNALSRRLLSHFAPLCRSA